MDNMLDNIRGSHVMFAVVISILLILIMYPFLLVLVKKGRLSIGMDSVMVMEAIGTKYHSEYGHIQGVDREMAYKIIGPVHFIIAGARWAVGAGTDCSSVLYVGIKKSRVAGLKIELLSIE